VQDAAPHPALKRGGLPASLTDLFISQPIKVPQAPRVTDAIDEPQGERHHEGEGNRDDRVDVRLGTRPRIPGLVGVEEDHAKDSLPPPKSLVQVGSRRGTAVRTQTNAPGRKRVVTMATLFMADVSRCASQAISEVKRLKSWLAGC